MNRVQNAQCMPSGQSALRHSLFSIRLLFLCIPGILCLPLNACQAPLKQAVIPNQTAEISTMQKSEGAMQLQTFQQWISLMQQYGGDTSTFQQQYTSDQDALQHATTRYNYNTTLSTLRAQIITIKIPALRSEAQQLQQNLQRLASSWEQQHLYHDNYNNVTYHMGFEYDTNTGIGSWVEEDLNSATTVADYQQIIESLNIYLTNIRAMQTNAVDITPYNQVHRTDLQLIKAYRRTTQKVLVISLTEQAMRVYDHGRLVNAFLVTTGRPEKPSRPGNWWVESHERNIIFKADVPQNDPYWYPNTPINYAMQYHSDGYFVHDSWWRVEYGPNTQFPHQDTAGDTAADLGSHGCVNMSKADAEWVYNFVSLFTGIIIY